MFDNENEEDWLPSYQKSIEEFEKMYSSKSYSYIDSDSVEEILDHYIKLNNLKKAKWAAERALEHFPTNTIISIKFAQVLSMSGHLNQALEILQKIEHIEGLNVDVLLMLADIHSQLKNQDLAISYYKKVFQLTTGDEKVEVAIDLAMELENQNKYDTAIQVLKEAMEEDYSNDLLIYELAHCYEKSGDFDNAIVCFLNYIDEEPYSYTTWYNLGNVYSKVKNYEKAIWAYEYVIAINDEFIPAVYNLANIFLEINQAEKALKQYLHCLDLDKEDPILYCSIGECLEELGEFEGAYNMFCKSTSLLPRMTDAWVGRAVMSDFLGFSDRAIIEVQTAINIDDKNEEYWRVLANIYEKEEQNRLLAIEAYETALSINKNNDDLIVDYLSFLGDISLEMMYRGVENNRLEDNHIAQLSICYCHWKNGSNVEAMVLFEELINKNLEVTKKLFDYFPEMKSNTYYYDRIQQLDENYNDEKL